MKKIIKPHKYKNKINNIILPSLVDNHVHTVVIDGNIVVQNKKILSLDEEVILDDVRKRYLSVAIRAGIKINDFLTIWPVS